MQLSITITITKAISKGFITERYTRQNPVQDLYNFKKRKEKCLDVTEKANPWRKKIKLYVSMFKT